MNYKQSELTRVLTDLEENQDGYNIAKIVVHSDYAKTKTLNITNEQLVKIIELLGEDE